MVASNILNVPLQGAQFFETVAPSVFVRPMRVVFGGVFSAKTDVLTSNGVMRPDSVLSVRADVTHFLAVSLLKDHEKFVNGF